MDEPRNCDLLTWIDGHFVRQKIRPDHMFKIGRKLAELQLQARRRAVKHRRYWTADGLMGPDAKLGSVYGLKTLSRREQGAIEGAARELLSEFRSFSKTHPERMGLIHADLHFGNAVFYKDGSHEDGAVAPIDFDDSGYGFYLYDLCVPYVSLQTRVQNRSDRETLKAALFEGYASLKPIEARDQEMFDLFCVCRRLMMIGWLNSRADNPRLRQHFRPAVDLAIEAIRTLK